MTEQNSKAWLQRLKDESWEAELLVAAISIFGTLQLFSFVRWMTDWFIDILPPSLYIIAYFVVFSALLAVSILSSMFIIHFMLRAYWVGLVGLNSVFYDYDIDGTKYSKIYMEKLINALPKLDDSIQKADRLCSVIFAAAFGFLMAYGWIFISSAFYLFIANRLMDFVPKYVLLIPVAVLLLAIIFQIVLSIICNIKRNKDNVKLQTAFYKISMLITFIVFGPLYKATLQISAIFSSNFKKDKALVKLVLLFVVCGFCFAAFKVVSSNVFYLMHPDQYVNASKAEPRFYLNQAEDETLLLGPQLNSNVIKSQLIEVFIPVFSYEHNLHHRNCNILTDLTDPERAERRAAELKCFKQHHQITINGQALNFHMIKTNHMLTKQYGVMAYVEIGDALENAYYTLEIQKTIFDDPQSWQIPFYYLN